METLLIYPAILNVKYNGKKMSFETPKQAEDALATLLWEDEEEGKEKQHGDSDSG